MDVDGDTTRPNQSTPMETAALFPELLDAAALFAAVLCWGTALFPAAGFWGLYNQRAPS